MINVEKRDKIDIITFSVDRINALITDELREEINNVFGNGVSKVILDLRGIGYIDSSGFGCLLTVLKSARNNYCTLKLANPEPAVMQVLQTLHLQTVFEIYDDLDACIRSMK
ncbi:MAG TPA: STAS domain-containing protein [Bacteroidales bacterium]|nr:STAS domain-containing protein [Bacteroidales bacterium]